MKVFGLVIVFIAFVVIGYYIKCRYDKKTRFFKEAVLFCDILSSNINYSKMTVKQIIKVNSETFGYEFKKVLTKYLEDIDNLADFEICNSFLKRCDTENLIILLKNLGKTDMFSQIQHISNAKSLLNSQYNAAVEEGKRIGMLGFKLCICLGLISVVLLI